MNELEAGVRKIELDGLVWGASKMVPVGFGIKMLQITLVIEDDKISLELLQEKIEEDEEHVQSTDIVSFFLPADLRRTKTLTSPQAAMQKL
jgi:elongation factor 1-beta